MGLKKWRRKNKKRTIGKCGYRRTVKEIQVYWLLKWRKKVVRKERDSLEATKESLQKGHSYFNALS